MIYLDEPYNRGGTSLRKSHVVILLICTMVLTSFGTYLGIQFTANDEKLDDTNQEGTIFQPSTTSEDLYMAKIQKTYQLIKESYVEEVESKTLIEGAVEGMLASLNDPYSVYMNEEKAAQFNSSLDSSFQGIGAEVTEMDGKIIIVAPFKNSPAEKAGLKPYDEIIRVDGEEVTGLDVYEVTLKIRGEKGTKVELEIVREGVSKPLTIEVVRDTIPIETVFSNVFESDDKKIGYIEITSFSRETSKDFTQQLAELEEQGIEGLIIDVRGNPGGLLTSVEEIAGEFISSKKPILQIENRDQGREKIFSKTKKEKPYPVVVLTDKGSASASEILAAALKEAEGYPVIGERTFGKGTVQQQVDLGDKSNIKLTMYKWLTPDGNWIHQKGIEPDIHVSQSELYQLHPLQIDESLHVDMNHEQVKYAQMILKNLGLEPGRVDGYFSETTEAAVKLFQEENKLPVTGRIDGKTAEAMEEKIREKQADAKNDRQLQMALKYFEYKD